MGIDGGERGNKKRRTNWNTGVNLLKPAKPTPHLSTHNTNKTLFQTTKSYFPYSESPPLIDLTTPTSNETHTPHQDTPPPPPPPPRRNIIRLGPLSVDLTDGRAVQLNPIPSIHVFQGRQFMDEDEELEFILNATRRTLQHSLFHYKRRYI